MKKWVPLCLVVLVMLLGTVTVFAEKEESFVYVTVAVDGLSMSGEKVVLTDADGDGNITVNDVLMQAHKDFCPAGREGYSSVESVYGLSLVKLWNAEGGFGYYVNNVPAMSLLDFVKDGDYVVAFSYTDTVGWSDTYAYFDQRQVSAAKGDSVTLSLVALGYDASWNLVSTPVAGAKILLNGKDTGVVTDEKGKATIKAPRGGEYIVSAEGADDAAPLVPPVCRLSVEKSDLLWIFVTLGGVLVLAAVGVKCFGKKYAK